MQSVCHSKLRIYKKAFSRQNFIIIKYLQHLPTSEINLESPAEWMCQVNQVSCFLSLKTSRQARYANHFFFLLLFLSTHSNYRF